MSKGEFGLMPAGRYYVGDLCYVLSDSSWDELCTKRFGKERAEDNEGKFILSSGKQLCTFATAYGDGFYPSTIGFYFAVDSGSLGCILESDIEMKWRSDLSTVLDFPTDFLVSYEDGKIRFGKVVTIDTDPSEEDE